MSSEPQLATSSPWRVALWSDPDTSTIRLRRSSWSLRKRLRKSLINRFWERLSCLGGQFKIRIISHQVLLVVGYSSRAGFRKVGNWPKAQMLLWCTTTSKMSRSEAPRPRIWASMHHRQIVKINKGRVSSKLLASAYLTRALTTRSMGLTQHRWLALSKVLHPPDR